MYKIINRKKLFATMAADAIGSVLYLPRLLRRRPMPIVPEEVKSILVIRTAYVGDVVMTLPILKPLRSRFKDAKISFLTSKTAESVLQTNPYVDEVIAYSPFWFYPTPKSDYFEFIRSIRQRSFDLLIEARGDIREFVFLVRPIRSTHKVSSAIGGGRYLLTHVVPTDGRMHRVEYHLDMVRFLGCRADAIEWGFYHTAEEMLAIDRLMKDYGVRMPFVAAHPGSRGPLKKWASDKCAALYDRIMGEIGLPVAILGGSGESAQVREIAGMMKNKPVDLAGRLTLREVAGLVSRAALFVCNDSAPMHVAAAMNTPTVAIFGPSKSRETGPYGNPLHRVVEKEFPCRFTCDETTCRYRVHNACLHAITPDDVFKEVKGLADAVAARK